jgi:3-mercaptopyruvate sulfurtransferase SseA
MPARRRQTSNFPLALIALGLLLILGAGGWYLYQVLNPRETVQPPPQAEGDYPGVPRVSLADAKAAYETGSAVFLDVRDAESYAQNHIVGALSIPLNELPDRMGELDKSAWIITYCT